MPTPNRDLQVHSVWTAKVQHVFSMMKVDNNNCNKHLFTFPFETVDDSLVECGHGSCYFQHSEQDESNDDKLLASMSVSEPIVVTTASVHSLTPGVETDEDAIDLCIKWYVFSVKFFTFPKIYLTTNHILFHKGHTQ